MRQVKSRQRTAKVHITGAADKAASVICSFILSCGLLLPRTYTANVEKGVR
jgi:hypothetical protein